MLNGTMYSPEQIEKWTDEDKLTIAAMYDLNSCADCGQVPNDNGNCICGCPIHEPDNPFGNWRLCQTEFDSDQERNDSPCWQGTPRMINEVACGWTWVVNADRELAGVEIMTAYGGPNIWTVAEFDQPLKQVGTWWGFHNEVEIGGPELSANVLTESWGEWFDRERSQEYFDWQNETRLAIPCDDTECEAAKRDGSKCSRRGKEIGEGETTFRGDSKTVPAYLCSQHLEMSEAHPGLSLIVEAFSRY